MLSRHRCFSYTICFCPCCCLAHFIEFWIKMHFPRWIFHPACKDDVLPRLLPPSNQFLSPESLFEEMFWRAISCSKWYVMLWNTVLWNLWILTSRHWLCGSDSHWPPSGQVISTKNSRQKEFFCQVWKDGGGVQVVLWDRRHLRNPHGRVHALWRRGRLDRSLCLGLWCLWLRHVPDRPWALGIRLFSGTKSSFFVSYLIGWVHLPTGREYWHRNDLHVRTNTRRGSYCALTGLVGFKNRTCALDVHNLLSHSFLLTFFITISMTIS